MKSTIQLTLCESTNIAGYGYDLTLATLAVKFKAGPGGKTYHYAGVPAWLYTQLCAADSKGSFISKSIIKAVNPEGKPLYPATLMEPDGDDDEGEEKVEQPTPKPVAPTEQPGPQKPADEPKEKEAA